MADAAGLSALAAWQKKLDQEVTETPEWEPSVKFVIDHIYGNPLNGLDVASADLPHAYGPSMRRLWVEAKQQGKSDQDAWESLALWAFHRPPAWDREDARRKKRQEYSHPEMSSYLARRVDWSTTGDARRPWAKTVDGKYWQIGLNDFPDDMIYTLITEDGFTGDFHDWPVTWQRDG